MNESNKLRGGGNSELTRFKELWKKPSFADSRDYWLEQFSSARTQQDLRSELLKKLKINLHRDNQLTAFRQWADAQAQRELMAQKIEERKKELLAGGMTLEESQDVLLTEAAAYSTAARDFKLGLKVSSEISKATTHLLDQEKFKESLRTKLESAFAELATACKGNAEALQHIQKARALLAPEKPK